MADSFQGQAEEKEVTSSSMAHEKEIEVPSSSTMALQNDVILKTIFGFMCLDSLKNSRLVNRQWKRISLPICWERTGAIKFKLFNRFRATVEFQRMTALTQLISTSSGSFPCRKFTLLGGLITDNPNHVATLDNFFREIAPIVEELELNYFVDYGELPRNLQFPRLKQLALENDYSLEDYEPVVETSRIFLKDLILRSPRLTTLKISSGLDDDKPDKIQSVIGSVPFHKINSLYVNLCGRSFDGTHWNMLANIDWKLRFLEVRLEVTSNLEPEIVEAMANFLSSQSGSLEELNLSFFYNIEKDLKFEGKLSLPRMEKLKHLNLTCISENPNFGFARISCAKQFPAMQSLSLWLLSETCLDAFLDFRNEPLNTVTSLELPMHLEDPAWVWQAARIFPNVRKLMIFTDADDVIMALFEACQKVEELSSHKVWQGDTDNLRPIEDRNHQAVQFLQNLKVLRIVKQSITDQVCRLILVQCGSLRLLDLSKSYTEEISKEVLQEMEDKFSVICGIGMVRQ